MTVSRQRLWQKQQVLMGRCALCGKKRPKSLKLLCRPCQDKAERSPHECSTHARKVADADPHGGRAGASAGRDEVCRHALDNGMQITLNLDDANALWDGCQEYALWRPMCAAVYNLVAQCSGPALTSAVLHEHVVSLLLLMGMKMGRERAERDPLVKLFRREGP
jgi:hypothetical protein